MEMAVKRMEKGCLGGEMDLGESTAGLDAAEIGGASYLDRMEALSYTLE
jgi:hypothetical protein